MKSPYINNRFLEDATWYEIQHQSIDDLFEGKLPPAQKRGFNNLVESLISIAETRAEYAGHLEAKAEDDFVSKLGSSLGMTRYAKPKIEAINRVPDFTFSRLPNTTYMNLYQRSRNEFWKKTDFILEVKPVGFVLEDYDPDTGRLWVDKCAWLAKSAGVKIGILTNFSTWYFVRSSAEDEAKFVSLFLDGAKHGAAGDLIEFDSETLRRNATAIAKMMFLVSDEDQRNRIFADFDSVDNEELDVADSLLPRFVDAISLLASDLENDDSGRTIREATTNVFCIWSVLSRSEILGLDVQKNLNLGEEYLGMLKTYLESPTTETKASLDEVGSVVCKSVARLHQYVIGTLPSQTQAHFNKVATSISVGTLHGIAFLLFVETAKNKITLRGTHRLGASSISTVFEGTLGFKGQKLNRNVDRTPEYWHESLGPAPEACRVILKKVQLVEPPVTNDKKRKKLGAYFTPTPICDHLIGKLDFTAVEGKHPVAFDPTCGTGQFLVAYLRHLSSTSAIESNFLSQSVAGNDIEPLALFVSAYRINSFLSRVIGSMNTNPILLTCHDFTKPQSINYLKKTLPKLDHVVGNPPFGAEGNSHPEFKNTWQSCLDHVIQLSERLSIGLVLPASFANTGEIKTLRNKLISNSARFHAVAFDTRPTPIFPDNDQRPIFITFDYGYSSVKKDILSGGYRRHTASKSIQESLNEIEWQVIEQKDTLELFPLPSNASEANLVRIALDLLRVTKAKKEEDKQNLDSPKGSSKKVKIKKKDKEYPISVLSYGRYNLNAMLGEAPTGGGKKWKTFYYSSEELAARMVVGLNSNLGWSLFRSLTNGLDFNNRLEEIIATLPTGIGKKSSCLRLAKAFSEKMRASYKKDQEYQLAGRAKEFALLNKAAESAFRLKSLGISVNDCSDVERLRVLKEAA